MLDEEQLFLRTKKEFAYRDKTSNKPEKIKDIFTHQDDIGNQWEQSYQFISLASSEAEVLKVSYSVKLEIVTSTMFSVQHAEIDIDDIQIVSGKEPNQHDLDNVNRPDLTDAQLCNASHYRNKEYMDKWRK